MIGRDESLISMGILGFAMQACQNVGEALELGLKYHPISGSALNLTASLVSNQLELKISERFPNTALLPFFCEEIFCNILTFLSNMIGEHDDLLNVQFSYAEPQHFQLYRAFFDCPIPFNTSKNSIFFNIEILKRPLKSYSPANYTTAIRICEKTLDDFNNINHVDYKQRIQHLIEEYLPELFDMQQAADTFQISERQLRRILVTEGINFQTLRQNILEQKAKIFISQKFSMTDISQQLGFSELREFRRAFKRWTGHTPSFYREKIDA